MSTTYMCEHLETSNAVQTSVDQPVDLHGRQDGTWDLQTKNFH
jgi:hypothetical protein